jgi:hypothetical protein
MSTQRFLGRALSRRPRRGQALVELAIILPLLLLLVGGIIQYGALIATKHTLTQVGRDVGRWAATQSADPCADLALETQPATRADEIAVESRLMGYDEGSWVDNFTPYGLGGLPADPPGAGVEVAWEIDTGGCPPADSTTAAFVTVRLAHEAPVLLPGLEYLPGLGTCDGSRCFLLVTTTAQFRMEPQAQPTESGG